MSRELHPLEDILEGISDALFHVDETLTCRYANSAGVRLFSHERAYVEGRPLADIFPASLQAVLAPRATRAVQSGESDALRVFDRSAERWFNCRLYPSKAGLSILIKELSGTTDETSDVDVEAPRVGEEHFLALADATPQIVWTLKPSGAVTYLNQPGQEYFGIGEESRPFGWADRVHPDDLQDGHERWRVALESSGLFEAEFRLRRHDGAFRWHLGRALPIRDAEGHVTAWCGTSTDIENLKRAQAELAAREQHFRTMADAAPVMIWKSDTSGRCTYFNKGWLDYTGRSVEDELGFGWADGVHPEDLDRCLTIYNEAFDAKQPFTMEYRLRRTDGAYRWILDNGTPLLDASGDFNGFVGSALDIHDRKQLENQSRFLAEASPVLTSSLDYERTLRTVADLIVPRMADWCAIDMVNDEGNLEHVAVAHVNPAKVEWAQELRRKYPPDLTAPQGLGNVIRTGRSELYATITDEMIEKSARSEEHLEFVRRIGLRSVLIVPLEARGQILGALTLVWSDSERTYSEADLEFAEELARRAAIVVDNSRLYRLAREARDELEALNETLEARVVERTNALTAANEMLRKEVEERRRAQDALARANTQLEHRNRELQEFAYVASHDLQEPLRKIISFASLLSSEYGKQLDEGQPYLERIENAADRMMELIRDLLAFSKVSTQAQLFRVVDLDEVVRGVLADLEVRLAESGGRVETGSLCAIYAEPLHMRQLFQNLIGNALKFHRPDVSPVVTIDSRIEGDMCVIEVRDNGIGFDERHLERIFSPFQRLHTRENYPGTGMGLAICRRITERHDGSITARSKPGEGSTFIVELPVSRPEMVDSS